MQTFVEDPSQRAGFVLLAGFLLSFLFIRFSTRMMRSPKYPWWPGSISTGGGVHVHHLVFGIALMICAGFVGFAVQPEGAWMDVLAGLFGVGVGLTVDEFALWLYLEDVYWTDEGRSSVDVFIIVALVGALVLVGIGPFETEGSAVGVILLAIERLGFCALVLSKGKVRLALLGFFVPFVFEFAAIRLARPNSPWARRFYPAGSKKLERATIRAARWDERRIRWLDRVGGAPHLERSAKEEEVPRGPG